MKENSYEKHNSFRVNSTKAVEFRNSAINILKNYTIKGYALDNNRLANGFIANSTIEEIHQIEKEKKK